MAVEDYSAQLDRVDAAIKAIEEGAQSYSIGSRAVNRADLKTLYEERRFLRKMVAKQSRSSMRVQYAFPER